MEEMSHISDVLNAGFQADESPEAQAQLEAELQELLDEAERAQTGTEPVKSSAKPAPEPVAELAQAAIDTTAPATTVEAVPSATDITSTPTAAAITATQPAPAAAAAKTDKKAGKGKKQKQKQQQQEPAMSYAGAVKTTETNVEEEEEESLPVPPTHTVALSEGDGQQEVEEGEKGEETAPVSA